MDCAVSTALTVTEERLESLAPAWRALLERAGLSWPFLHPAWLDIWLKTSAAGRELLLLGVREGEELRGVAPLLRQGTELMLAGDSEICDYMDIVAAPGLHEAVLDAVLGYLTERDWQRLILWGLRADSRTLACALASFRCALTIA